MSSWPSVYSAGSVTNQKALPALSCVMISKLYSRCMPNTRLCHRCQARLDSQHMIRHKHRRYYISGHSLNKYMNAGIPSKLSSQFVFRIVEAFRHLQQHPVGFLFAARPILWAPRGYKLDQSLSGMKWNTNCTPDFRHILKLVPNLTHAHVEQTLIPTSHSNNYCKAFVTEWRLFIEAKGGWILVQAHGSHMGLRSGFLMFISVVIFSLKLLNLPFLNQ